MDITDNAVWSRLDQIFPGIGREFMPPLDEGSLLFMPSLLPSASLTEAKEIIARQDIAIQSVPEVKSVVGKVGRVDSALDPAPIDASEKQAIIQYHFDHPLEGYRRLTCMLIDADIVACSAGTVYSVLSQAGLLKRTTKRSHKLY